jgi:hypothetical protein
MPNNYNKDEQEIIKKIHSIMKERNLVFISLFKLEGVLRVRLSHSYWDDGYYTPLLPAFEFKLTDKTYRRRGAIRFQYFRSCQCP